MNSKSLKKIAFFHAHVRFIKINFKIKQNFLFWFSVQCSGTKKDWIRKEVEEKWWSKVFVLYLFVAIVYGGVPGI